MRDNIFDKLHQAKVDALDQVAEQYILAFQEGSDVQVVSAYRRISKALSRVFANAYINLHKELFPRPFNTEVKVVSEPEISIMNIPLSDLVEITTRAAEEGYNVTEVHLTMHMGMLSAFIIHPDVETSRREIYNKQFLH